MKASGKSVKSWVLFISASTILWGSGPDLERARKLYNLTEFQQSLQVLQAIPEKNSQVWELVGRNYYGEADFKKATEALEKSVAADPSNADAYLWLGRAYGRRAETSNPITAPGYAKLREGYAAKPK
jgi:tetratricopeptide (TPR) repeat protein